MLKSLSQIYYERIAKGGEGSGRYPKGSGSETAVAGGIPKFKNTNEAMSYGEKIVNDPEKYQALQAERNRLLGETAKIRELGDNSTSAELQRGMNLAVEAQFVREAMESADRNRRVRR